MSVAIGFDIAARLSIMNTGPNKSLPQNEGSQNNFNRDRRFPSPPPLPRSVVAVSAKLKEAQANLLDADKKLIEESDPNAPPAPPHETQSFQPPPSSQADTMKPEDLADHDLKSERKPETVKAHLESAEEKVMEAKVEGPTIPVTEHLSENVAGMLCYLFGWVSGLIFLLVDRRSYVRFHAAQSVAVFATLNIVLLALGGFFLGAFASGVGASVLLVLTRIVELAWLVAAVVLMLKAAGGERFHVKYASDFAERAAHGAK
jgi:uncharacterized membrane protein